MTILYEGECYGEGQEQEEEDEEGNSDDNNDNDQHGRGGQDDSLEDNDLPIPSFSPDNTLDNADFHEGMIFEGEDFNVNFRRNIPINARHRDFQDGAVREIVYNVNFDQSWNNVALGEVIGDLLNVFQAIIDKLKECYNPSDLVRFHISNRAFNAPRNL